MARHDIVVIGASAGGIEALLTLLPLLPADLPAAVFVAQHRARVHFDGGDPLAQAFRRRTKLTVVTAADGQPITFGHLYVAPPGCDVMLDYGIVRVVQRSPPLWRASLVDELFRSAAGNYGSRVVGVLLSGMLSDGTAGCWEIRKHGGVTIVQDPAEADFSSMPDTAMKEVPVHYCLPIREIAPKLVQLVTELRPDAQPQYTPRVLIVEDERIIAMNLESRLTELGYHVVASLSSGEAALRCVISMSPDIVLMDIHLASTMSGTEAARILWEQYGVPIVYLTAYADEETVNLAKPSMPYAYIVKPYRPAELHSAIQLALARREREKPWLKQP